MMADQQPDEPIAMLHTVPDDVRTEILCPITIFQVLQSDFPDRFSKSEGREKDYISVVAHVTSVQINPARVSFALEDGTGKIWAAKDFDSLFFHLSKEAEEDEIAQFHTFEHTFVEVIGSLEKYSTLWKPRIKIKTIHQVNGYNQVMYHILNVIHASMLSQQGPQDLGPSEATANMLVDDSPASQHDTGTQCHVISDIPASSQSSFPSTFSPQKHHPYASLGPLEKLIMKHMCHRDHAVSTSDLALAIQKSSRYTEDDFNHALQALLSEAYLTSPLDDGYVVVTPRH